MSMRRAYAVLAVIVLAMVILIPSVLIFGNNPGSHSDKLYQVGQFDSLLAGNFSSRSEVRTVIKNGDFGLGTFTGLDGEMIVVDGRCYKASVDGKVVQVMDNATTPFAQVTYFDRDGFINTSFPMNMTRLEAELSSGFERNDTFTFIKIDGTFPEMKVRSVPMQIPPYPSLATVVSEQVVFDYHNVTGTLIGLWSPAYAGTLSYAGFHFHFISDDRSKGGHVLGFELNEAVASIDYTSGVEAVFN
jgi:acetolactate decarboxylase